MKWYGLCSLCDVEVFEIEQYHTKGDLTGMPCRPGKPKKNAWRTTYRLSDGTTCDLTLCAEHAQSVDFAQLWRRCIEAFRFENSHRKELGVDDSPKLIKRADALINQYEAMEITDIVETRPWRSVV